MAMYTCDIKNLSHGDVIKMWFSLPAIVSILHRVKILRWGPHVVDRDVNASNMNLGGVVSVMCRVLTMCPRTLLMGPIVI